MTNKHTRELNVLDDRELALRLEEAQNDLIGLRFNLATRKTYNTSRVADVKRQIARIKTIQHERAQEA